MSEALAHSPLNAGFGVSVDADLSKPLAPEQQAELRKLFDEHGLIVLRGQKLSHHEQIRVMSYLKRGRFLERDPEFVSNTGKTGFVGATALAFHSDSAFMPEPMTAVSLHAIDVVEGETSTKYSSNRLTYRRLPAELRARVDGLHTLHVMPGQVFARNRVKDLPPHYPRTSRLLVHRHPYTGDPVLYISSVMIDGIVELPEDESEALLAELHDYVSDPAHLYEHVWRNGDVVIWDNVALLHARDDTSAATRRLLQRVSMGAGHFSDVYPEFPAYNLKYAYQDA